VEEKRTREEGYNEYERVDAYLEVGRGSR